MNILLTSVGRRSYLVKYFKEAIGVNGEVHVSNSTSLTPAFLVADKSVVSPLIYSSEYIPFLLTYCRKNSIDMIISLFDIDLPILAANRELFDKIGVNVVVSDESVIEVCNDKYLTYKYLVKNGFNTPKTYISLAQALKSLKAEIINYPVVIKPRWRMGSIGVTEANNEEELIVLFKKTLSTISSSYLKYESRKNVNKSIIIQEKLKGQEYGLDVINNLEKKYQTTIVKIKHAMRSGETDCAETINNLYLKELGANLGKTLHHVANLDVDVFLVDNIPYVLEINARFGGGYPFSHVAGVNLPLAIIKWAKGIDVPKELLKEKNDVLSHKDIVIAQLPLFNNQSLNSNVVIEQIIDEKVIKNLLIEFDLTIFPSISHKVNNLSSYSNKLAKNALVFVAKDLENMGFVTLYANNYDNKVAYISFISVKKEYRSMNVGTKLLSHCFDVAKLKGMDYIKLEVQNTNNIAIDFYLKNGFEFFQKATNKSNYYLKKL